MENLRHSAANEGEDTYDVFIHSTVFNCQNSSLDYFDTVNKFIEKKMEESSTTKLLMNARKAIRQYRILFRRNEAAIRQCSALVN